MKKSLNDINISDQYAYYYGEYVVEICVKCIFRMSTRVLECLDEGMKEQHPENKFTACFKKVFLN